VTTDSHTPDEPHLSDDERRAQGFAVRREVLSDGHVDRAIERTTWLTADFQDFITRVAWGEIWSRPELDRRTRSVVVLAALITGGHHTELRMHLVAAYRNGLTISEIREIILQTAIYAGVPAANAAYRAAIAVFGDGTVIPPDPD
jgi:3-oxoadipate enol-lactonase/4-carboxymuconolactone decarboxylase